MRFISILVFILLSNNFFGMNDSGAYAKFTKCLEQIGFENFNQCERANYAYVAISLNIYTGKEYWVSRLPQDFNSDSRPKDVAKILNNKSGLVIVESNALSRCRDAESYFNDYCLVVGARKVEADDIENGLKQLYEMSLKTERVERMYAVVEQFSNNEKKPLLNFLISFIDGALEAMTDEELQNKWGGEMEVWQLRQEIEALKTSQRSLSIRTRRNQKTTMCSDGRVVNNGRCN